MGGIWHLPTTLFLWLGEIPAWPPDLLAGTSFHEEHTMQTVTPPCLLHPLCWLFHLVQVDWVPKALLTQSLTFWRVRYVSFLSSFRVSYWAHEVQIIPLCDFGISNHMVCDCLSWAMCFPNWTQLWDSESPKRIRVMMICNIFPFLFSVLNFILLNSFNF